MLRTIPTYHHPETDEQIYDVVYKNRSDKYVRGTLTGTAAEVREVFRIFADWDVVYSTAATPRSWKVYQESGYQLCWGQEVNGSFQKADMPTLERQFTLDDICYDRYLLSADTGRSAIIVTIDGIKQFPHAKFMGRSKAPDILRQRFIDNNYKPFCYEYQSHSTEWLESI